MITKWMHPTLRSRIFAVVAALVLITLAGSFITVWYVYRVDSLLRSVLDRGVKTLQAAEELQTALAMQRGFVTYYFLTGEAQWLHQLEEYRHEFEERLKEAAQSNHSGIGKDLLSRIGSEYASYLTARDKVIKLYQAGERDAGSKLHWAVREQFSTIMTLCEGYKELHQKEIDRMWGGFQKKTRFMAAAALVAMPGVGALSALLAYILLKQVFGPIRQLVKETDPANQGAMAEDEVKALERGVYHLIEHVDETKTKLERSRRHLIESEKLASTGRLAAGVAHSIRNPLTSVKMRLFSLRRNLELSESEREDFEVISEEIRHIDTIVQNFLEFSRPPKLKMQKTSPSDVVDMAVQLLRHRLDTCNVQVELNRRERLPETFLDSDQLKEVLVNLMINASEAMRGGGLIAITEERTVVESMGSVLSISVSDNGPGIPESIQDKIFQPFFSTKEEGTGLGLGIASRIVEEHGGWLDLRSREGEGATFIINLPLKENTT
jgi:signal transduction histidine kinase